MNILNNGKKFSHQVLIQPICGYGGLRKPMSFLTILAFINLLFTGMYVYIYIHTLIHAREWRKEKEIQKSISKAFEKFKANLTDLEKKIDELNQNKDLKNRYGAAIIPYEAMKPRSKPGITGSGVPYSVSI
uniref:Lipoxygenase domain-containing protein n=1 Tax=Cucumis sativus TaxID=3659 RepID=A0A0A0KX70_CUCSA